MKIQGVEYKKRIESIRGVLELPSYAGLIVQQKGLNADDPQAHKRYCRIMVNTENGKNGEYVPLKVNPKLSKADLAEYDSMIWELLEQ